uniref:Uncharacterized protein n=1 Tax=Rhizophora mucronata TaxID=61149 RepID=A0A2P2NZR2_RHIMU
MSWKSSTILENYDCKDSFSWFS